jgi:hypothetical protein
MNKILLLFFFISTKYVVYSQDFEKQFMCYNGIKDSLENGVDCGPMCGPCNGEVQIIFNGKEYKTGKTVIATQISENSTGRIIEKNRIKYTDLYIPFTYLKNREIKRFAIYFRTLRLGKMEPKIIYLTGGNDKDFENINTSFAGRGMTGGLSENIVFVGFPNGSFGQLKNKGKYKYVLEITKVDNLERVISGNIEILGMTTDGSPVEIKGAFNEISF